MAGKGGDGSVKFTIRGSAYMRWEPNNAHCDSIIRSNPAMDRLNFWLMGTPFFRIYETSHDMDGLIMGFKRKSTTSWVE